MAAFTYANTAILLGCDLEHGHANKACPTVHERLARCGERVYVDGLVVGADVVLSVGGVESNHSATGGAHNFVVLSLTRW